MAMAARNTTRMQSKVRSMILICLCVLFRSMCKDTLLHEDSGNKIRDVQPQIGRPPFISRTQDWSYVVGKRSLNVHITDASLGIIAHYRDMKFNFGHPDALKDLKVFLKNVYAAATCFLLGPLCCCRGHSCSLMSPIASCANVLTSRLLCSTVTAMQRVPV